MWFFNKKKTKVAPATTEEGENKPNAIKARAEQYQKRKLRERPNKK